MNNSDYNKIFKNKEEPYYSSVISAGKIFEKYNNYNYADIIKKLAIEKTKKEIAQEMIDKLNNDKELQTEFEKLMRKQKLYKLNENQDS